jgi:hypothetical protein
MARVAPVILASPLVRLIVDLAFGAPLLAFSTKLAEFQ